MNRLQRIAGDTADRPLFDVAASRLVEALAAADGAPQALMQAAGLAVARLALALAPHAGHVWIAAGPGNNGGDGFEAALHLTRAGKQVLVSALGDMKRLPPDAAASLARAQAAGARIETGLPAALRCDVAIDALLGIGATRAPGGAMADALRLFNVQRGPRLSVDLPSGLDADRGTLFGEPAAQASDTLTLLTLKPGLFTARGREHAGEVWFDDLMAGAAAAQVPARAWLGGADAALQVQAPRRHGQHKGSFGDVVIVGGAAGMTGAALLAGRSALAGGAGRVYVDVLDPAAPAFDAHWPELMLRRQMWLDASPALATATVVCGCGGGDAVRGALPVLLARAPRLVLDADALNSIAVDEGLQDQLVARGRRGQATVLTPHPLEAARLAGVSDVAAIQADRLGQAERLAARYACVVLLKGSGSVIAAPGQSTAVNASGNARLASAGTGDVLAGWIGGLWAAAQCHASPPSPQRVAQAATWLHGAAAGPDGSMAPLTASRLLQRLGGA